MIWKLSLKSQILLINKIDVFKAKYKKLRAKEEKRLKEVVEKEENAKEKEQEKEEGDSFENYEE